MPSRRRRQFLQTAAAGTVALAGCTTVQERFGDLQRSAPERRVAPDWRPGPGTWAERGHGPANTNYNPSATPPRTEPTVDWRREFDYSARDGGSFVVAEGRVFVEQEYELLALDASDGQVLWTRSTDAPAQLAYVDGRLYQFNSGNPEADIVAWSPDGEEQWRTTIPDQIRDIHEQQGYVFVAGRRQYWTLHADTGAIVRERDDWVRNMATAGEGLYAAFAGILVRYEVDGRTLSERWRAKSDYPAVSGHPVVGEGRIYVPQHNFLDDGEPVVVYDTAGKKRGGFDGDGTSYLTLLGDGSVLVPTERDGGGLVARRPDGSRRWRADVTGRAEAIAADGTVFGGFPLTALDGESGERLWELDVGGPRRLAAVDSTLYVRTHDSMLALRA
ncbi:PQQ-binding-like beta-propeller repeat protein [Haloarchaeobius sp. TZWSO28]|uniref:outer membrane protein assembly factor BamB family protein n=1 Tax=Haloarchaeobius sp. TZWSO28 TaxID=3446119 RepID=UPI003EC00868